MNKRLKSILELAALIGSIVLIVLLIWYAFGDTVKGLFELLMHGDSKEIQSFLQSEGEWKGVLCTIILAIIQVISIVLPGFAIQIAAGVIYGWWKSFLMCYFGFILGNVIVFFFARRVGSTMSNIVSGRFGKNQKTNAFLEKMKSVRPSLVVAIANLLPVVPNGIVPYIAANSSIRNIRFVQALMATCWVQIFFNCLAGNFLISGQYVFMAGALGIQVVLLVIATKKGNQIMDWLLTLPIFSKNHHAEQHADVDGPASDENSIVHTEGSRPEISSGTVKKPFLRVDKKEEKFLS